MSDEGFYVPVTLHEPESVSVCTIAALQQLISEQDSELKALREQVAKAKSVYENRREAVGKNFQNFTAGEMYTALSPPLQEQE